MKLADLLSPKDIATGKWWSRPWGLVDGCTHVSRGCDHCWSATRTHRAAGQERFNERYAGLTTRDGWTGKIKLNEHLLGEPLRWKKRQVVAVWNDLSHERVPVAFIRWAFSVMSRTLRHVYVVLTKRPSRMVRFLDHFNIFPVVPNIFLGTSVEDQETADLRLPYLAELKAAGWRTLGSVEPVLGDIHIAREWMPDWLIAGIETGAGKRGYKTEWLHILQELCEVDGVPFWLKHPQTLAGKPYRETPEVPA